MELIRNINKGSYGLEGEVFFALFQKYIEVTADEPADVEYVAKCAAYLNALNSTIVDELCLASIRYCNDFLSAVGEEERIFAEPRAVLELIYPSVLLVPAPAISGEAVVHLELNCAWEEEHGMEWIVRGDEVKYVGAFHGEDAWGDFSSKEVWNYA
jgi:hypothetical protein